MGRIFADKQLMKTPLNFIFTFFVAGSFILAMPNFVQGQNGFNIQNTEHSGRKVFVPENSKLKVKLDNGKEFTGFLSGADSNAIYLTGNNGKQKTFAIGSINKMTVFHPHDYFTLLGGLGDLATSGSGNGSFAGAAIVFTVIVAITASELIVDGIADIANDDHYDLQNNWKIIGPVLAR